MSFPRVLNLAFTEGHNIEILPHILYQTGTQLTSGQGGTERYSVSLCPPTPLFSSSLDISQMHIKK